MDTVTARIITPLAILLSAVIVAAIIFGLMGGPRFQEWRVEVISGERASINGDTLSGLVMRRWNPDNNQWEYRRATEDEKRKYVDRWTF